MLQFKTTEARISGAVYGHMWMPNAIASKTIDVRLKGPFGCHQHGWSLADTVDRLLMNEGGDFRDASFTADSELIIVRKAYDAPGKYRVHVRTIPLSRISPDHVGEMETCDVMCSDDWED